MKKLLLFLLFISLNTLGQSVTISPETIEKQNSLFDDIKVSSFGIYPSIIGLRANGTVNAKTALLSGDIITQIGVRGFNGTSYSSSRANIRFKTTQAWTSTANGSSITFETTPNNSIIVAQRMVINHDGNVGIGTNTPSYPLSFPSGLGDKLSFWGGEINNTTNHYGIGVQAATLQLYVPTVTDNLVFGVGRSASFSEKLRVTGNGNVQIQGSDAGYLFADRTNVAKGFQWYSNAGNAYLYRQHSGSGNVMTVLENGNVGIGTNTPTMAGLVVDKLVGNTNAVFGSNTTGVSIESNWPGISLNGYYNGGRRPIINGFVGGMGMNPTTGLISIYNTSSSGTAGTAIASTDRVYIDNKGNVGIGNTPTATLDVARGTGLNGTALFNGSTHSSHFNYGTIEDTYIRGGKDGAKVLINDIASLGSVQVGNATTPIGYKMSVDGKIICTELEVLVTPWPDYVFKPSYKLKPLHEVEKFITENGHLPNIPKAEEIENKALAVGNMSKLQMEKIEELTLYLINMNKRLEKLENENKILQFELTILKSKN